ncbi:hypothetical protein GCM10023216_08070 [Isoptericola chiayiensis]|uniref:Uncharacterized protein n=1 Tax=Isoptericola chiayiensis TaxID=579446 RepID=A0ABP8Y6P4_9MICO
MPLVSVLRVTKVFPQVQVTSVVTYSGWIPLFMMLLGVMPPGRLAGPRAVNRQADEPFCQNAGGRGMIPPASRM